MKKIKAFAVIEAKGNFKEIEIDREDPAPGEVQIRVRYCGICHTDLHYVDNDHNETNYPFIPGHEIIGEVIGTGSQISNFQIGDIVGVGWQNGSCMNCEPCLKGSENICSSMKNTIDFMGGFSEVININEKYTFKLEKNLQKPSIAPIFCAGVTSFNPFYTYGISPTSKIGIIGAGGLGHFAIKFADKMGMDVTVFSHSVSKKDAVMKIGADYFVSDINNEALNEKFDFILSTAPADLNWNRYLEMVKPGGSLCFVGFPTNNLDIDPGHLILSQKKLLGGSIGSPETIKKMLNFANLHNIEAEIELIKPDKITEAFNNLRSGNAPFRYVVDFK